MSPTISLAYWGAVFLTAGLVLIYMVYRRRQ